MTAICGNRFLMRGATSLALILSLVHVVLLHFSPATGASEPATTAPSNAANSGPALSHLDPSGVRGTLMLVGGGRLSEEIWERFRQLVGDEPHLVIIPTARQDAKATLSASELGRWRERGFARVSVLHLASEDDESAREPSPAGDDPAGDDPAGDDPAGDDEEDQAGNPVAGLLAGADAVWISGGQQSRVTGRYLGTAVEQHLRCFLERGGVIGGTSAGAAVMSRVMIAGGNPIPRLASGFDWLPDAIVDQHFSERNRQSRLELALEQRPGRWGLGIDEGTAVFVRERRLEVFGQGAATLMLARGDSRDAVSQRLEAGEIADVTSWRRAARERLRDPFPPAEPKDPRVAQGALVIVGGGGLPRSVMRRFLELAGGPDARIVVLPTALPDPLPSDEQMASPLTRAGARNVRVLRERHPQRVGEEAFLEELRQASGVWLGGGRQWRFVDAYEETPAQQALRDLLQRGGVIGGSSAGASIQAEYLVRGSPLGNREMMARGYERGLGFLAGTAIDQHFTQRNRSRDLASVVQRFPQLLGIGIDEATALLVQGSVGEVVGTGAVHFFSSTEAQATSVTAGGKYDLKARRREVASRSDPVEITEDEGS